MTQGLIEGFDTRAKDIGLTEDNEPWIQWFLWLSAFLESWYSQGQVDLSDG